MSVKRLPRPRDPLALAKLIGDIATGQVVDVVDDGKDPSLTRQRRASGMIGGAVRSATLDPQSRAAIAKKAALARWGKKH